MWDRKEAMHMSQFLIFDLIYDWPYLWPIPSTCRECGFLEVCRKPWWEDIKSRCYAGCRRARTRRANHLHEDYWAALLDDVEKHQGRK